MVGKTALLVIFLSVQTALSVNAEDAPSPLDKQAEAESPGQMEEVTVYGQKTLLNLERAMIEAENKTFKVFNSLNTEDQYDIRCYKKAPLGSHIKHRVCYPNYVADLRNEAASVWSAGTRINDFPDRNPIITLTKERKRQKKLREIWGSLAEKHPEMLNAIKAHAEAKQTYVSEKEKRCKRLIFTCQGSE